MAEKNSWFSTGVEDVKKAREQMRSQFRPELWLKDGEFAKVIVLDKEPFNIMIHQVSVRGKFKKYTCVKKNCPLCKVDEPRFISVYRVIDTRSYEDKNKKVHKNVERYWEIGTKAMAQVESLEEDGNFYGKIVKIKRTGAGPKTAYAISFVGEPEKRFKATLKPIDDYRPKSIQELQTLAELLGASNDDDDRGGHGGSSRSSASRYYEQDDEEQNNRESSGRRSSFNRKNDQDHDDDGDAQDQDEGEDQEDDNENVNDEDDQEDQD